MADYLNTSPKAAPRARTGLSKLDPDLILPEFATRTDYDGQPEDLRAEIIDGVMYPLYIDEQGMVAAPLNGHEDLVGEFFAQVHTRLRGKAKKKILSQVLGVQQGSLLVI